MVSHQKLLILEVRPPKPWRQWLGLTDPLDPEVWYIIFLINIEHCIQGDKSHCPLNWFYDKIVLGKLKYQWEGSAFWDTNMPSKFGTGAYEILFLRRDNHGIGQWPGVTLQSNTRDPPDCAFVTVWGVQRWRQCTLLPRLTTAPQQLLSPMS